MKPNDFSTKILYLLNPIAILVIANEIVMPKSDYFSTASIAVGLIAAGLSLLVFITKKKWLSVSYHSAFGILFGIAFATFPMGIVFALTGGIQLTAIIILLVYLPLLALLILNIKQVISLMKNH